MLDAARDGVGDVGRHVEAAHRGHEVAAHALRDLAHAAHHLRRRDERVVADAHGRGPRVVLHAVEGDARPRDGHDALDDADGQRLLLEDRSLLDVQLEVGAEGAGDAGLGAEIADPLKLVAETVAVLVARVVGVLERDLARHDAGADHGGLKARPLLVGEDGHRHRMPRPRVAIVERADGLERAEHAELAVVLPAGRHGVRVRAHQDRGQMLASRAQTEDIAHPVHGDGEPGLAHPSHEEIAAAPVLVGQREAREPARRRLADPAQPLHALLESLPVDPHLTLRGRSRATLPFPLPLATLPSLRGAGNRDTRGSRWGAEPESSPLRPRSLTRISSLLE